MLRTLACRGVDRHQLGTGNHAHLARRQIRHDHAIQGQTMNEADGEPAELESRAWPELDVTNTVDHDGTCPNIEAL